MSRAKAMKYKMGTDPVIDAWVVGVPPGGGEGGTPEGTIPGMALWVVDGRFGVKPIWLPQGIKKPKLEAVTRYFQRYGGGAKSKKE